MSNKHSYEESAVTTLVCMGYTHAGGTHWRPPLGKKPDFDLIDSLRDEIATLRAALAVPQDAPPQFPTMLRKMWTGAEVQAWIDANWKKS